MLDKIYTVCRLQMAPESWYAFLKRYVTGHGPEDMPGLLELHEAAFNLPGFLPDLARLEWALYEVSLVELSVTLPEGQIVLNPTLSLLRLSWKNLTGILIHE